MKLGHILTVIFLVEAKYHQFKLFTYVAP